MRLISFLQHERHTLLNQNDFAEYIRGRYEPAEETRLEWQAIGWMREDGKVTQSGLEDSGILLKPTYWLQLGSDVKIHSHTLPKGMRLPIVWADRESKDRRNWYWVVALPTGMEDPKVIDVPLSYSPRHEVLEIKLPMEDVNEKVLY